MKAVDTFDLGDLVRCQGTFKNIAGASVDPATVSFKAKDPVGTVITYVFGTDAQLVRDSSGLFHVDVDANKPGTWFYRFFSTGSSQAASEGQFVVQRSQFS